VKITRREFFPALGAFTAFAATLTDADKSCSEEINLTSQTMPADKPNDLKKPDPTSIEILRLIDPNLSNLIVNLTYYFTEPIVFHKLNYEKFKQGKGDISEENLIHNNSDKWANAMACLFSYFIAYAARFPFTLWIAKESSDNSPDIKRQSKIFSDFMTINTSYGQTLTDRFLTNSFQHELREAYKKLLRENPKYGYQPWAIPLGKTIQTIKDIYPPVIGQVSQECKNGIGKLKNLTSKNHAIEWMSSKRNQLDLLLIFLSYVMTFVDIIPLVTGGKVNAYTANTATGRLLGSIPCQALLCKDLIKKLKEQGDIEGSKEERVMATAGLYNVPLYFVINSAIQSVFDSAFNLKQYSDNDVAYSNLREIIGTVNGSIIYMFIQYKLESSLRANIKKSDNDGVKESPFTRFAGWYIKP